MSFATELVIALIVVPLYTWLVYCAGHADMLSDVVDLWIGRKNK